MYTLFIEPEIHAVRRALPGHMRQRIHRLISDFTTTPRPSRSRRLELPALPLPDGVEIWRVRLEQWRIVYAIHDTGASHYLGIAAKDRLKRPRQFPKCGTHPHDTEAWVWVLAIKRRPPYDYDDIPELVRKLSN